MAALYALGSLTQHEARSFEIHVREGCAVCEEELHRFQNTTAGIGLAVDEVDTPEYIRDLLVARIEREPQTAGDITTDGAGAAEASTAAALPSSYKPALFQAEGKKSSVFAWVFIAFFALLAILATLAWRSAEQRSGRLRAAATEARADADNLRTLLDIQKGKPADLDQFLSVAGLPGARAVRMVGQSAAPSSSGAVLWDSQQNQCLFFGLLPPTPPGKAYQLWINTPTVKASAGMIKTPPTGRTFAVLPVPKDVMNATAFIITLEPEGGSQAPTPPYYVVGDIQ